MQFIEVGTMTTSKLESHNKLSQVKEHVFKGKSFTSKGEVFYLHMELLTKENEEAWTQYAHQAKLMTNGSECSLTGIGNKLKLGYVIDEITDEMKDIWRYDGKKNKNYLPETGFSEQEFDELVQQLGTKGFQPFYYYSQKCAGGKAKEKLLILGMNWVGCGNMCTVADGTSRYIVYATKKPEFNILDIPKSGSLTLKEFRTYYDNILMSVGSDFSQKDSFENRGIFRNPFNVVDETYNGIAMSLHAFAGAVAERYFPEKKSMVVSPIPIMQVLICASLKAEDVSIDSMSFDEARQEAQRAVDGRLRSSNDMPKNTINIAPLAKLYLDSKNPKCESHVNAPQTLFSQNIQTPRATDPTLSHEDSIKKQDS